MSQALPFQETCCQTCDNPVVANVAGPQGEAGAAGADGAPGKNAFTTVNYAFAIPGYLANITITVISSEWMTVGMNIYIEGAGNFRVINKPSTTTVEIKNLSDGVTIYTGNLAPGTVVPSGATVSASGVQGPSGAAGVAVMAGDVTGTIGANAIDALVNSADILTKSVAAATTALAKGTDKRVLHVDDAADPQIQWKDIDLTGTNTSLSGLLPIANGGTAASTAADAAASILNPTAVGDIWYASTVSPDAVSKLPIGSSGQVLAVSGGIPAWTTLSSTSQHMVVITERYASGVNGGTWITGLALRYNLVKDVDTGSVCTLTAGTSFVAPGSFTLATGYYRVEAHVPVGAFNATSCSVLHRSFITTSGVGSYANMVVDGTSESLSAGNNQKSTSYSKIIGRFQVTNAATPYYLATFIDFVDGALLTPFFTGLAVGVTGSTYEYYSRIVLLKE